MNRQKREYHLWGVAFAIAWNIIILSTYTIVSLIQHVPFAGNIEVDTWTGFVACYALATAVWYYIGYALRKEYVTQQAMYTSTYQEIDSKTTAIIFKLYFFRKYVRTLIAVFATAIPWYLIVSGLEFATRDIIFISTFAALTLIFILASKALSRKIDNYR